MSDPDDENIRGVVVDSVREGLPAAKAGLQVGDLIVKFKGKKVRNGDDLRAILKNAEAGENAEMLVLRDGEQVTLNVNLEAYDDDRLGSRVWAWDSPQQSESHADAIAKVLAAIELLQENKNEPGVAKIHEKLLDALTKAHEELERPQARSFNFGAGDLLDGNGMVFAPRIRTTDPEALREQLDQLRELREELEESKEVRKEIEELRKEIEKLQRGDE